MLKDSFDLTTHLSLLCDGRCVVASFENNLREPRIELCGRLNEQGAVGSTDAQRFLRSDDAPLAALRRALCRCELREQFARTADRIVRTAERTRGSGIDRCSKIPSI